GILRAGDPHIGPGQHVVDLLGEEETTDGRDQKGGDRLDEPPAQLDQVVHQGRLAGLDLLVLVFPAHAVRLVLSAGSACSADSGTTGPMPAAAASGSRRFAGVSALGSSPPAVFSTGSGATGPVAAPTTSVPRKPAATSGRGNPPSGAGSGGDNATGSLLAIAAVPVDPTSALAGLSVIEVSISLPMASM